MDAIRTEYGPAGEILHVIPHPPAYLPPVTKRDLERAWDVARDAALTPGHRHQDAPPRGFRFARDTAPPLDLVLNDQDAASWAGAIDRTLDLSTAHGVSVCLRLLALVELMASAAWARSWFSLNRRGVEFNPALLQAAALTPLTETGGFAETALRALLPAKDTAPPLE